MTLTELSKSYEEAAVPLRKRLSELRKMLAETDDPEEIWHINRRIAELSPMLTQMNDLAWMLEHYYERGGADRDARYGFNGIRKPSKKRQANEDIAPDIARRINRFSTANILGVSHRKEDNSSDCGRTRCEQKHCEPDVKACGTESLQIHEVLPDVSIFFAPDPKKNRRNT